MRLLRGYLSLFCLAAFLLLAPAKPLYAAPVQGDEVVLGDDLTLHEGEHIDGDLVMMGGNLTMRAGSRVEGSITAFGGRVEIDGVVKGEVVALGGDVTLGTRARVGGEVVVLGGHIRQAEGAQTGRVIKGAAIARGQFWRSLRLPLFSSRDRWSVTWTIVTALTGALIMTLLGMAVTTFWPTQTAQVGKTILVAPLPSLGVGCLLYPLGGSLIVFVLITLCLIPFAPFLVLLLVTASLFGWVALGTLWGRWLVRLFGWRQATPLMAAGAGVFALTIVATVAGAVPCLGPLLVVGAASIGLGAVALSRFGTSRYRDRPTAVPPVEA
jgi:cytoskeletal protein CcmA (bactofilin family)